MEIKPEYYDEFKCIADKCSMTCCMQWKIAVDDETYAKWKNVNYEKKSLASYVKNVDGSRVIGLNEDKKCPFITECGLCNLVLEHGDKMLSNTCDVFPRQVHEFENRTEYSLVSCCPEVVEMLKIRENIRFNRALMCENEDELFNLRGCLMAIMENEKYSVQDALLMSYYVILDVWNKCDCDMTNISYEMLQTYAKEATLRELHDGIKELKLCWADTFEECNELWLDMVENYRKEGLYVEDIEEISLLAEELSKGYDEEEIYRQWQAFMKVFGEYDNLFKNYLVSEFFTNMLIPDSDMESMVVMMQWISMEYVMIRQGLFLRLLENQKKCEKQPKECELNFDLINRYIVIISRMTGYDQEDIYEYMENSFQSLIWDWGYMWLIVGKSLK